MSLWTLIARSLEQRLEEEWPRASFQPTGGGRGRTRFPSLLQETVPRPVGIDAYEPKAL